MTRYEFQLRISAEQYCDVGEQLDFRLNREWTRMRATAKESLNRGAHEVSLLHFRDNVWNTTLFYHPDRARSIIAQRPVIASADFPKCGYGISSLGSAVFESVQCSDFAGEVRAYRCHGQRGDYPGGLKLQSAEGTSRADCNAVVRILRCKEEIGNCELCAGSGVAEM